MYIDVQCFWLNETVFFSLNVLLTLCSFLSRSAREVNMYGTYSMRSDAANFAVLMWEVMRARLCNKDTPHTHVAPYCNISLKQV